MAKGFHELMLVIPGDPFQGCELAGFPCWRSQPVVATPLTGEVFMGRSAIRLRKLTGQSARPCNSARPCEHRDVERRKPSKFHAAAQLRLGKKALATLAISLAWRSTLSLCLNALIPIHSLPPTPPRSPRCARTRRSAHSQTSRKICPAFCSWHHSLKGWCHRKIRCDSI